MRITRPTQLQGISDLTVVADIKQGLIEGIFESRSYAWRLTTVLRLLDAARHASRESSLLPNPFIDSVGRLRGVQFFRFVLPPSGRQLFLNVTFDGGWEPYIRQIWGPLGTLLDLIFCHCVDYPLAAASDFNTYVAWIRRQEAPCEFFYADSASTAADRSYMSQLEALQRTRGGRADADLRAARQVLQPPRPATPSPAAVTTALRSLKGLYGLTRFFGMPPPAANRVVPGDDGSVLFRFAQDFLPDLRDWYKQGLFDPGQRFDTLGAPFKCERQWLMASHWTKPTKRDLLARPDEEVMRAVQAGIFASPQAPDGCYVRGALVLVRVKNAPDARAWLKTSATGAVGHAALISDGSVVTLDGAAMACTVAITYPGLKALGVHQVHLDALPGEFIQGMEARAGILGDLRGNHPLEWKRPRAGQTGPGTGSKLAPIDLGLVDLVIQLRTADVDGDPADDRSELLPCLKTWIAALPPFIEVLAVEPGWSKPRIDGELAARNHFGYVDGISQPTRSPLASIQFWDDAVKTGELLLGWLNDRGDGPTEMPDGSLKRTSPEWLDFCSFLVVRKIRQHVERFDAVVNRAAQTLVDDKRVATPALARELVRTKLVGRDSNGQSPAAQRGTGPNDFDYRHDSEGAQCAFASHVRRANPRATTSGGFAPPRIVRRGLTYGPPPGATSIAGAERGVLFMAYNASIAEQFEVIQRWLTGGNSSGVSSSQPDPLLGVPQQGEPSVFRCTHDDQVLRIDLGDEPINSLEWGLYTFVPSMALLRTLDAWVSKPAAPPAHSLTSVGAASRQGPGAPVLSEEELALQASEQQLKDELGDQKARTDRLTEVRCNFSGVQKVGGTVVVGSYAAVMEVLRDDGSRFSVSGYGKRMGKTVGMSPFGQDDAGPTHGHERAHVAAVKEAIGHAVTEEAAFVTAREFVKQRLAGELTGAQGLGLPAAPVDVVDLGTRLVAHLCAQWFGVVYTPGGVEEGGVEPQAAPVRCPGHFLVAARKVFSAYPNATADKLALAQAQALKAAVTQWFDAARYAPAGDAPVREAVLEAMRGVNVSDDERQGTLANVMLGLPATLLGTWFKVLVAWIDSRQLWRLQHDLAKQVPKEGTGLTHGVVLLVLRAELIRTMTLDPVADGIWRTAAASTSLGKAQVEAKDIVWLGLGSALVDSQDEITKAEELLFGGAVETGATGHAPHACPGRGMAMGALLGALSALLLAGEWAATPSPTTLTLKPASK